MKKSYSLDYDIYLAKDRNQAIINILTELDTPPNQTDLEQMADYILFGKDEKHISIVDSKEALVPHRRYGSYRTKAERNESLEELAANPAINIDTDTTVLMQGDRPARNIYKIIKPSIRKPTYDDQGNEIDPGDGDLPFMRELWDSIDKLQERYDMYRGVLPPNEYVRLHPMSKYMLYRMGHALIDLKRQQYYIKDCYRPAIHFFNVPKPGKSVIQFDQPTGLWLDPLEWCERKRNPKPHDRAQLPLQETPMNSEGKLFWKISDNIVDYENPAHILALIDNYAALLRHSYSDPNSHTRDLCFDLELFVKRANLTDVEQFVLEQRVAHRHNFQILKMLKEEGLDYSEAQLRSMYRITIPRKLATTALQMRLDSEVVLGERPLLVCTKCGEAKPAHTLYFARSRDKKTGFCSQCKVCQKKKRDAKKEAKLNGNR